MQLRPPPRFFLCPLPGERTTALFYLCIILFIYLFIYYFWLCWVSVAVKTFPLVHDQQEFSLLVLETKDFSLLWFLLLLQSMGSGLVSGSNRDLPGSGIKPVSAGGFFCLLNHTGQLPNTPSWWGRLIILPSSCAPSSGYCAGLRRLDASYHSLSSTAAAVSLLKIRSWTTTRPLRREDQCWASEGWHPSTSDISLYITESLLFLWRWGWGEQEPEITN